MEWRARLPLADWIRPALWLMPVSNIYGGFPASGEIDMMESSGNLRYYCGAQSRGETEEAASLRIIMAQCPQVTLRCCSGVDTVQSTLHMGLPGPDHRWSEHTLKMNTSTHFAKEFHIYELNWTEEFLAFSVDGEEIYR